VPGQATTGIAPPAWQLAKGYRPDAPPSYNAGMERRVASYLLVEPPLIRISVDDPVLRFAAAELIRYGAAAGQPPCVALAVEPRLEHELPPLPPALGYRVEPELGAFAAATPRELLQAVYHWLGDLGWRWYVPGPLGEVFLPGCEPTGCEAQPLAERVVIERARVKHPSLWRGQMLALIDWMGKQGFTHLAIEGDELEPATIADLGRETDRRGIVLEVGGDIVGRLLAATRQVVDAGRRSAPFHRQRRLEVADPAALAALPAVTATELARLAPAAALRLAEPESPPLPTNRPDVLSPAQRFGAVAEAATAGLAGRGKLWIWQPSAAIRRSFQRPEGAGLVLPIARRDLGRGLDDLADPRHGPLLARIQELAAADSPLEVAAPYVDATVLGNLAAPLGEVIDADLRALAAVGVGRVALTIQAGLSWWLCPYNLYVAARRMAGRESNLAAIRADWCRGLYGAAAAEMEAYLAAFEIAMQPLWRLVHAIHDPAIQAWRAGQSESDDLLADLSRSLERLPEVSRHLDAAAAATNDPLVQGRLQREQEKFALTQHVAQLWLLRTQGTFGRQTLGLHGAAREQLALIEERLANLPTPLAGAAADVDYVSQLDRLARWCGYDGRFGGG